MAFSQNCGTPLNQTAFSLIQNQLNSTPPPSKPFSYILIGDTQMSDCYLEMFADITDRISSGGFTPPLSFIINVGDVLPKGDGGCPDGYEAYYNHVQSFMSTYQIPYITIPGNHELDASDDCSSPGTEDGLDRYLQCIGDTDWMFDFLGCRFIGINNVQHDGVFVHPGASTQVNNDEDDYFEITQNQIETVEGWLDGASNCVFTFSHVGLARGNYICNSGFDGYMEYYNLLLNNDVTANFHGHIHEFGRQRHPSGLYDIRVGGGGDRIAGNSQDVPCDFVGNVSPPTLYQGFSYSLVTVNQQCEMELDLFIRNGDSSDPYLYNEISDLDDPDPNQGPSYNSFNDNLSQCKNADCGDIVEHPIFNEAFTPNISPFRIGDNCYICIENLPSNFNLTNNIIDYNDLEILINGVAQSSTIDIGNGQVCFQISCEFCSSSDVVEVRYMGCSTNDESVSAINFGPPSTPSSNQEIITPVQEEDVIITEECTDYLLYRCIEYCDGNPSPSNQKWIEGRKKVTVSIINTDCSSAYSIHVLGPNGWLPHHDGTTHSFFVPISGNYEIRVRQDNFGLDANADPNGNGKRTLYFYKNFNKSCCLLVPDDDCLKYPEIRGECINEYPDKYVFDVEIEYSDTNYSIETLESFGQYNTVNSIWYDENQILHAEVYCFDKFYPYFEGKLNYLIDGNLSADSILIRKDLGFCNNLGSFRLNQNDNPDPYLQFMEDEVIIYPNPTAGIVYIRFTEDLIGNITTISLFDFEGKRIREIVPQNQDNIIPIQTNILAKGIYNLLIIKKDGTPIQKKFLRF